ncbi:SMI1/KNR4 family protein [Actinokineospora sp. G85]|uniref:SMI1/KNR4 family protein n=1 Tax=Actinokineospora sp. G85 TaxID=3406626 RepID=UPI003C791937
MSAIEELARRGRGPLGPPVAVEVGEGLPGELSALLSATNGFAVFNYGVQVFHRGQGGLGPELGAWNGFATWKHTYGGLADDLLCFAQDLFGVQFAIEGGRRVSRFDPETGELRTIGDSLEDWAEWLLAEPDRRGTRSFATRWQDEHGPLGHDERLLPRTLFVLGGEYTDDNLTVCDAVTAMRVRGPIARQVHDLPDGTAISLRTD